MTSAAATANQNRGDLMLVVLAGAHAALLLAAPTAPVIAIGLWWNANTISHYFIHRPFFRRRVANHAVRRISQRAARLSARPLARPPSGASCRSRGANAPVARPGDAGFARRGVLVRPAGRGAAVLSFGLPSGMGRRPAVVRRARLLRARARDDESLRPALQPAPVQRRLSRGAPCASVSALDAAADVPRSSRARQPLAGANPLARRRRVDPAGASGAAIAGAAAVPAARARAGIPRAVDARRRTRRHSPADCDRRWRAVPADRAGAPPDSSARAAHDHRRKSRAPERCARVADRRRGRIHPRAIPCGQSAALGDGRLRSDATSAATTSSSSRCRSKATAMRFTTGRRRGLSSFTTGSGGSAASAESSRLSCSSGSTWCAGEGGQSLRRARAGKGGGAVGPHHSAVVVVAPSRTSGRTRRSHWRLPRRSAILSSRPRLLWTLYGVLTLYAAMTVPVVRVLSSPLTWAMWRAARGPLADSIWLLCDARQHRGGSVAGGRRGDRAARSCIAYRAASSSAR